MNDLFIKLIIDTFCGLEVNCRHRSVKHQQSIIFKKRLAVAYFTVTKLAKQSVLYDREVNDPFEHVQYAEDE